MSESTPLEFVAGGALRYDHPTYIERKIERDIFRDLDRRRDVTIIGPRQVGKTSLLFKIQAIRSKSHPVLWVDLSSIRSYHDSAAWAKALTDRMLRQYQRLTGQKLVITSPEELGDFSIYWDALAEQVSARQILILLDEADSVPDHIIDDFYTQIRTIQMEREGTAPSLAAEKIIFVFAGVFEPTELVRIRQNSPFNASEVYRLGDFSIDMLQEWARIILSSYCPRPVSAEVVSAVYSWTAGHPYLTQYFANQVSSYLEAHSEVAIDLHLIDQLADAVRQGATNNLAPMAKIASQEPYVSVIQAILDGSPPRYNSTRQDIRHLALKAGAITPRADGYCQIRNRIYEIVLRDAVSRTPAALPNRQRCSDLAEHMREAYTELKDLERDLRLSTDSSDRRKFDGQINNLRKQIDSYQKERNDLGCSSTEDEVL